MVPSSSLPAGHDPLVLDAVGRADPAGGRPRVPSGLRSCSVSAVGSVLVALDLDLLLADLLGDLALFGHGLGVQTDPLLGHGPLLDHRLLLAEGDLVLLLGDGRAAGGVVDVGVGDRLALDPDLLALYRHRHLLGLGGHVLAQPGPAPLASLGADGQLLLGAGHGLIGGRPGHVPAHGVPVVVGGGVTVSLGVAGRGPADLVAAAVVQAVVAPQRLLLLFGQVAVGVHGGGVLDPLLLERHLDVVAAGGGLGDRHKGRAGAEEPGVDQGPLRLAGLVVDVDGVDLADAVAVTVDHGAALPAADGVDVGHVRSLPCRGLAAVRLSGPPSAAAGLVAPAAEVLADDLDGEVHAQLTPCRGTLHLLYRDQGVAMTHPRWRPLSPSAWGWSASALLGGAEGGA